MTVHLNYCVWEAQSTAFFLFYLPLPKFSSTISTATFKCDTHQTLSIRMNYVSKCITNEIIFIL